MKFLAKLEIKVWLTLPEGQNIDNVVNELDYDVRTHMDGVEITDTELSDYSVREANDDGSVKEPW